MADRVSLSCSNLSWNTTDDSLRAVSLNRMSPVFLSDVPCSFACECSFFVGFLRLWPDPRRQYRALHTKRPLVSFRIFMFLTYGLSIVVDRDARS